MAEIKGPWGKGGGRGPTGSGPTGSGPSSPFGGGKNPFEKAMRDAQGKLRDMKGGGGEQKLAGMILAVVLGLWLVSGFYRVNPDELGVVLRFGKYNHTETSGLNYHLPYPIEQVIIPSVTTVNKVEIGHRVGGAENPNIRRDKLKAVAVDASVPQNHEGQMLTGDRNIVDIDFEVQWKIDAAAPEKFLFSMRDPAGNVKAVAESAMREVIGRTTLDDVLTGAQSQIAEDTKALMQQMFDEYDAGVEIIAVNLSRPDVPAPVIDEFQDVKRAEQDKQTAESVAEGYRNQILPQARGEAAKMIQDAEAYKAQIVADAQGNASRFSQIYTQYALAKDVTKRRMYLETMETVLKGMPKVIVGASKNGGPLPVLPLQLQSPAAAKPTATTTTGGQ
ncbi:MAG: FtsH protease activity modulator HflK [Rickettsiales bacterium]